MVEFGDRVKAKSLLAGGQSGHPESPHFYDQAQRYVDREFKDVAYYREDVEKRAGQWLGQNGGNIEDGSPTVVSENLFVEDTRLPLIPYVRDEDGADAEASLRRPPMYLLPKRFIQFLLSSLEFAKQGLAGPLSLTLGNPFA